MRRITAFLGLLLVFLLTSGHTLAQEPEGVSAAHNPAGQNNSLAVMPSLFDKSNYTVVQSFKLKDATSLTAEPAMRAKAAPRKATLSSTADIAGLYVMTYKTLVSSGNDGGCGVTIKTCESADSIEFDGFFTSGVSVKAKVDLATMTFTIPSQKLYTHSTYGDISIALCQSDGTPDRKTNLEGTINDDGTISITSWWGAYVDSGTYADKFISANYNTQFEKSNGTMSYKRLDTSSSPYTYKTASYNVIVKQPATNLLTVTNFANYGQTVEISLNRDKTAEISSQLARKDYTNGDWYTYAITYDETEGKLTGYATNITVPVSTDSKSLTWGAWSLFNTGSTKYYLGLFTEGKITTDFDIVYPELSVTDFEGEGTEESPYLIKTLDDLILLSDKVAEVSEFPCTTPPMTSTYARIFKDKYFRMENDIDMSNYRFTPIGNDWQHIFAGTFDGNGHKITGLDISVSAYAGLFGRTDTVSVIKNLTVDSATVKGAGYYAAAIAAWSLGTIENCHVTNSDIYNTGRCAAGIAGIATTITNSDVTSSTIKGTGGNVASVAGEVDKLMENCHATSMTVTAGSTTTGYPSGGLAGSIYKGTVRNCYFSGKVDGSSLYSQDQVIGGIAGTAYLATVDRCFAVGQISGYYTAAKVGGIIGSLGGSKLSNSYAVGQVTDYSSKYTGGITGFVYATTDANGNVVQPEITSCYTATQMKAETYQYNAETEVRETLGTIYTSDGTTNPVISNIYFDNRLTNFTSTHYGATTSTLTSASGPTGFDSSIWSFTEGQYPVLKDLQDTEAAKFSSSAVIFEEGSSLNKLAANAALKPLGNTKYYLYKGGTLSTEGNYCNIDGDSIVIGEKFGTDTLFVVNGKDYYYWFVKVANIQYDGEGTDLNPYLIKTKEDLIKLSEYTTVAKQLFADTYFLMTNDIDLELDTAFVGICADANDAHCSFSGTFDGGGHTIHNMFITGGQTWTTNATTNKTTLNKGEGWHAFIGRLEPDGALKNLNMANDCKIEGWATLSPFVGSNEGLIDNCRNYADVTGYSCWIGGLAGQNEKQGRITNCYNAGHIISGYFMAGGIAGSNYGTIENCANVGDVEVKQMSTYFKTSTLNYAGGITGGCNGTVAVIKNCLNAGRVYSQVGSTGGIAGKFADAAEISNNINYGVVYNNDQASIGAVSGDKPSGTVKDNYYDAQVVALEAAANAECEGMTETETSALTSGEALTNLSTDIWQFDAEQYPVLKQFADEEILNKARKAIVMIPTGITAKDLSADATLYTDNGEKWTLADGTAFKIQRITLKAAPETTSVITDTLTVTSGSYIKPIAIRRIPAMPLTGAGTESDPYIINNATEWNSLSEYMTMTSENLTGKFVKIASDIDFTSTPLESFNSDGVTYFNATMDGNNKKLSGISLTTSKSYQGIFGTIGEKGLVKDLTVAGKVTSAYTYTGGLVGALYGTLDNCVCELEVTSTKANVAGIAGYVYSGAVLNKCVNKGIVSGSNTNIAGVASACAVNVSFTDCGNEATIKNTSTKSSYTAGLVGTAQPSTFTRCYNTGDMAITNNTAVAYVAGLVAYANSSTENENYVFTDCYNKGNVDAKAAVAGIVANLAKTNAVLNMYGCYNEGDITASATSATSSSPTAGISCFYTDKSVFEDCWNSGTLMSLKNVYVGGITGYYLGKITEDYGVIIKKCHNTGNIVASGNQGGGIIAYCANYVTVDSCYNTGAIEGGFGLGGIADAVMGANSVISNCWNAGNITTSTYRAGGIYAWGSNNALVENCFNVGNIASTNESGGYYTTKVPTADCIGGIVADGGARIVNCYNAGTVTGLSRVGGIAGNTWKGKTSLTSCYNIGKIVAPTDTCGALIGVRTTDNGKNWNSNNYVTDCYYVTDHLDYGTNNEYGTAITVAELAALDMGDSWISADNYSMPVLKTLADNDAAKAYSAAVVPCDGDTYSKITKAFYVGTPEGVTWTSSIGELTLNGNVADIDQNKYTGEVTLTATCGEYSKAWTITLDGYVSSINSLSAAGKNIVSTVYYAADGRMTAEPQSKDGKVYIVKVTYDDGSQKTVKLINK